MDMQLDAHSAYHILTWIEQELLGQTGCVIFRCIGSVSLMPAYMQVLHRAVWQTGIPALLLWWT